MRILLEAEGMRSRGHTVLIGVMTGGKLAEKARAQKFYAYEFNFNRIAWPITLFRILWAIIKHKIDVVNTHSSLDSWIGGIAARLCGKRLIRTRHLSTAVKPGLNSRILYGTLADFVVTTCSSIIAPISAQSGKRIDLFRSVATGVDPERIVAKEEDAKAFRAGVKIDEKTFLVGTACFMRSWKGVDDLLEAACLLRKIPQIKWVIIGGGHAERHHKKAAELGLEGTVYFTGHLEKPYPAVRALDVFCLLSTANEGVSQAVLQAAFLGRPLITTTIGGLPEVCIDKKTGYLVPPHSPRAVADRVLKLYRDRNRREEMGKEARKLVVDQFTLKHTLDGMEQVYG